MLSVEGWTTIRYLHAQGKSIRAIADELHVARNTVRAAIRDTGRPRYERPPRPNPKLDPFHAAIRRMVVEQKFIGSRILTELRAAGYAGGPTALYAYLRTLKAEELDPRVTVRFETAPGQQGQFDWSPYTVSLGGRLTKVTVSCLTLGFSRRAIYCPSLDETQGSIFEALETGLTFFAGAPKELLVDNARVFVSDCRPGHFAWNPRFLELCGHYAMQPIACQPHRPQTKGKVERPFFFLEEHFIKGRAWPTFEAFAQDLRAFVVDVLDVRTHATTQERPIDRFAGEQATLTPLPPVPFIGSHEQMRQVSWDCLLSFGGSRYSVPWRYAGKHVWVRSSQGCRLLVRNQHGEEIARHELSTAKGATTIVAAHYAGLRTDQATGKSPSDAAFLRRFPDHAWFVTAVRIQHPTNAGDHLRDLLGLTDLYAPEALIAAFAQARAYNTYSHRFIRGILEADDRLIQPAATVLPFPRPHSHVGADLGVYQQLLLEAGR